VIMRPFRSQHIKWIEEAQKRFLKICDNADELIDVQPDPYAAWKMLYRNKEMVKRANMTIAVWDGSEGGTAHCVKQAMMRKRPLLIICPKTKTFSWVDPDTKTKQTQSSLELLDYYRSNVNVNTIANNGV